MTTKHGWVGRNEDETIRVCRAKSYLTNELKKFKNM